MLAELSASQLAEWKAFDTLSPIGAEREDYRISYLSSILTNIAIRTQGKRGAKLTQVSDFLFKWDPESQKTAVQSVDEMKSVMQSLAKDSKESQDRQNNRRKRKPKRLRK